MYIVVCITLFFDCYIVTILDKNLNGGLQLRRRQPRKLCKISQDQTVKYVVDEKLASNDRT